MKVMIYEISYKVVPRYFVPDSIIFNKETIRLLELLIVSFKINYLFQAEERSHEQKFP